jgi:hypothetical protein
LDWDYVVGVVASVFLFGVVLVVLNWGLTKKGLGFRVLMVFGWFRLC